MKFHPVVKEILYDKQQINKRIRELGQEVNAYYQEKNSVPILLGLLKGCIPFLAELLKQFTIDCEIEFMAVASFHGGITASTEPKIIMDLSRDITGRDILIVEDIIESGASLVKIKNRLLNKGAKSVKIVTLLDKSAGRNAPLEPDWKGFDAPNEFLIGFGLDYNEKLRNLPYIAIADMEKIKLFK